ncbi:hypothetical protein GCM10007073_18600 [Micrococcus flavus]|nr:hypothetical protein GCM10007073_18600 [Micrococcus flavus]
MGASVSDSAPAVFSEEAALGVEADETIAELEARASGELDAAAVAAMVEEEGVDVVAGAETSSSAAQPVAKASAAMAPVVRSRGVRVRVIGPPKRTTSG